MSNKDSMLTHYDVMRVPRNATADEIKTAYWNLSKTCHPDIDPKAPKEVLQRRAEQFAELNEAYTTLFDQSKRRQYDELLAEFESQDVADDADFDLASAPPPPPPPPPSPTANSTAGTAPSGGSRSSTIHPPLGRTSDLFSFCLKAAGVNIVVVLFGAAGLCVAFLVMLVVGLVVGVICEIVSGPLLAEAWVNLIGSVLILIGSWKGGMVGIARSGDALEVADGDEIKQWFAFLPSILVYSYLAILLIPGIVRALRYLAGGG